MYIFNWFALLPMTFVYVAQFIRSFDHFEGGREREREGRGESDFKNCVSQLKRLKCRVRLECRIFLKLQTDTHILGNDLNIEHEGQKTDKLSSVQVMNTWHIELCSDAVYSLEKSALQASPCDLTLEYQCKQNFSFQRLLHYHYLKFPLFMS